MAFFVTSEINYTGVAIWGPGIDYPKSTKLAVWHRYPIWLAGPSCNAVFSFAKNLKRPA